MFAVLQSRKLLVVVVAAVAVAGDEQNVVAATVRRGDMPALLAHGSAAVADGADDDDVGDVDSMAQWPRSHAGPSFLALRIPQPYMQAFVSSLLERGLLAHFKFDFLSTIPRCRMVCCLPCCRGPVDLSRYCCPVELWK